MELFLLFMFVIAIVCVLLVLKGVLLMFKGLAGLIGGDLVFWAVMAALFFSGVGTPIMLLLVFLHYRGKK